MKVNCKNRVLIIQIVKFGGQVSYNEDMASKLGGITHKRYNKIIKNLSQPTVEELPLFATWLGVSLEDLIDFNEVSCYNKHRLIKLI